MPGLLTEQSQSEEFYPAEQGGHRKGWGLGPVYTLKPEQVVGASKSGVPQVKS